ncbi:hypothetical protein DZC73_28855 [Albitalea terrae]|uniref:Tetratricopeptide repeat protein n=1 Tax=Piscinibacter terrae TaxID=2496871 RepID=A0A3N7HGY3_9BURK|nr:hypothetical protein DZC73_28855 [Albitalea terrae]
MGFGGWQYYQSPGQVAARQLKQAAQARAEGHVVQSAALFAGVAQSGTEAASQGAVGLKGLLDLATLQALPAADAAQVLQHGLRARAAGHAPMSGKDVAGLGWALVAAHADKDPAGAKAVLDAIKVVETDKAKLATATLPLLERIVAADPRNAAAAIEYAELLDQRRDCARCEVLLAPHAAVLGKGEGARILGQIYAAKGRLDDSYALLQPYTEEKLKVFVKQQADYEAMVSGIEKSSIEMLRRDKAPAEFYKRYDAADEAGKREMVSGFIDEQMNASGALKALVQGLRQSAAIVPVALDLGIVTVQRAQTLSDTAARNAQFQAAEKVFLSIRGVVGNTDKYRLYLGQVYYWLGKQADGKKLFDELLASHKREPGMLIDVSVLLRSIGAVQEARALSEEAHAKATDNDLRWTAAHLRSVMNTDAQDELAWLERSDRSQARIRASIHTVRAQIAEQKGQRAAAKRDYELAAEEFAKMPESSTQLNSSALVHLALYSMEGDPKHRDAGLAQLDQALALMPMDSILLLNNVGAVGSAAAAAILGERIDLPLLHMPANFHLVTFLYDDEASLDRVRRTIRENEAVKKGLAYSEKAALLAPRNPRAYAFSGSIAAIVDDVGAMKSIATRATAAKVDMADGKERLRKLTDGSELKKNVEETQVQVRQAAALMGQSALQRSPASWAVAAGQWVDGQSALARLGQPFDADGAVKVAHKARALSPSAGTLSMLTESLENRAALRLAKANPAFAASLAKYGRLIEASTLMILHHDEDPEFRRLVQADPDIVEVMTLLRDRDRRFPSRSSPWAWLLFRYADPAYAQTLAARVKQDPTHDALIQLHMAVEPLQPETVIRRYHYALAISDRALAQRVLDEARKEGLELPDLLGRQLKG